MKAVILAAGLGTKIWPYAEVRSKCATLVCNKPLVRRLAESLLKAGADGLVAVVGHHAQSVRGALFGLAAPVEFVHAPPAEGTALAVARALEKLDDDEVVVAYGDITTSEENVSRTIRAARDADAPAMLVARLDAVKSRPQDFIDVRVRDDCVTEVVGHARRSLGHVVGGVFAFRRAQALPYLLGNPGLVTRVEVGGMPPVEADLAQSIQMMVEAGQAVAAVEADECWCDLDKPWDIIAANSKMVRYLAERAPEDVIPSGCEIDDSSEVSGRIVMSPGSRIGKRCVVTGPLFLGPNSSIVNGSIVQGPIHIGRDCQVRHYCLLAGPALGDECIVSHGAEFCWGVAFERVYFYHYCEIAGVVGACVDFGAATVCGNLRFDDGDTIHRIKGRREFPPDNADVAYFGDYSRTGVNAIIMPGVKTGAYSCVGPGVILYEDLPSRKAVFAKQEQSTIDWGPERYGW